MGIRPSGQVKGEIMLKLILGTLVSAGIFATSIIPLAPGSFGLDAWPVHCVAQFVGLSDDGQCTDTN